MPNEELLNGMAKSDPTDMATASLELSGGHHVYTYVEPEQLQALVTQKQDSEIAHKTRLTALWLASSMVIAILGFDMFCFATTGHGYKSPEWAIAIVTSVFLGAGTNQIAAVFKAIKKK